METKSFKPKYYIWPGITNTSDRESILKSMNINGEFIIKKVAKYYDVEIKELLGRKRFRKLVVPRQVSMFLMRKYTKNSLKAIAGEFDRDHTTAMHAIQVVHNLIDTDYLSKDIKMIVESFFD